MVARLIHYGPDDCHRCMVLQSAGYAVEYCNSLPELRAFLTAAGAADAVLVSDAEGASSREAVAVARTHAALPVVLFRNSPACDDTGVDLVVHCLTPPDVWLNDVETLIEKTRTTVRA